MTEEITSQMGWPDFILFLIQAIGRVEFAQIFIGVWDFEPAWVELEETEQTPNI